MILSIFIITNFFFFFFNDTATTEIYTLSLHDALPIYGPRSGAAPELQRSEVAVEKSRAERDGIRSEEHTSELQSHSDLVCRLLLEKKKKKEKIIFEEEKKKRGTVNSSR